MNRSTLSRHTCRTALFALLSLALLIGCRTNKPQEKTGAAPPSPSQLANDMIGTWVHVGRPGQVGDVPSIDRRLKFRTGSNWTLTRSESGLVVESFGGTYTLNGNEYIETQDYGDETWKKDNGKSFKFTVKVEGDTMTQFGLDNPWTEVWKRLK